MKYEKVDSSQTYVRITTTMVLYRNLENGDIDVYHGKIDTDENLFVSLDGLQSQIKSHYMIVIYESVLSENVYTYNSYGDESWYKRLCVIKEDQMTEEEKEEVRRDKCLEQNKDGTIKPCEVMKENEELKEMFEFICKQRFGYAWNMNKEVYIADIRKALKGEKTQWV